jgi:hypothetical protein
MFVFWLDIQNWKNKPSMKSHAACCNNTFACLNHTCSWVNHTCECGNYTRAYWNHTACRNHTQTSQNHTHACEIILEHVKFTLVRVEITLRRVFWKNYCVLAKIYLKIDKLKRVIFTRLRVDSTRNLILCRNQLKSS